MPELRIARIQDEPSEQVLIGEEPSCIFLLHPAETLSSGYSAASQSH